MNIVAYYLFRNFLVEFELFLGTIEERGLLRWLDQQNSTEANSTDSSVEHTTTYDLPFGMAAIRTWKWARYIPTCPTFTGFNILDCGCRQKNLEDNSLESLEEISAMSTASSTDAHWSR